MADDVQVKLCLVEITKLNLQLNAIVQDIRGCDGPLETLQAFNNNARETITELKGRFSELERLANEQDRETDKIAILKNLEGHRQQLANSQGQLRKANISSQLLIEKKEKDALMTGNSTVRNRGTNTKENLAKTSGRITENLMSLNRTLAEQAQRSEQTMGTLISSSGQITDTQDEFKSMSGHIRNSRKLLTKFGRREFTDKCLIVFAIIFFMATAFYIFKKRFLSRFSFGDFFTDTVQSQ